MRTVLLLRR